MKTLEQIKNDYATNLGYISWKYMLAHLVETKQCALLNLHINEVMKIYAMECLKLASENAEVIDKQSPSGAWYFGVCEESITNENNIIK